MNEKWLVRENVRKMKPYSSARSEFSGKAKIFLDANESPYENGINRYPDPQQRELKKMWSQLKGVAEEQILIGNGSDELIDLLFRAFCRPAQDQILICSPTYGMYQVVAEVNDVSCQSIPLDHNFQMDTEKIKRKISPETKLIFICSPNNPTGNVMDLKSIIGLLDCFEGLLIVDEAYIDFSESESMVEYLEAYPNLVVLQTLSKAWGMAGLRVGFLMGNRKIVSLLNRIKMPYNVNVLSQKRAMQQLAKQKEFTKRTEEIKEERECLIQFLKRQVFVRFVYPSQANFLLVKCENAGELYQFFLSKGVVLRDRSQVPGLENCIRFSIGTKEENQLVKELCEAYASWRIDSNQNYSG